MRLALRTLSALVPLLLAACASAPTATDPAAPAAAAARAAAGAPIAATAHPLATRAALDAMAAGGSVVDAALAAQLVLGLVEPQSSGLGGGTLALYWDAASGRLSSLDGLAAAPARTTPGLEVDTDGSRLAPDATRRGGRSVGVPGTLALFEQLHRRHGRLPWAALFEPAIALAERGYPMPRYLHEVLAAAPAADISADLRALYGDGAGRVLPVGATLHNRAYAQTLRLIAERGRLGWLQGGAAGRLVAAAQGGAKPGLLTEADVLAYRVEAREPLCRPVLHHRVCMTGPASFGGVVVLQTLKMLEMLEAEGAVAFSLDDPNFVHRYAEAGRLAQADRQQYLGDPAHAAVPVDELLDEGYLRQRAQRIDAARAMGAVRAGTLPLRDAALVGPNGAGRAAEAPSEPADATSQMAFVDARGNALSITTTINLNFGSWLMVDGYVLNNAMTNFSPAPPPGQTRANQMAPGKRPITSMAPAIVFDGRNLPVVVGGSAGGGQIVDYIGTSLIEMLAADRTPQQALARGHVSTAVAGVVQLEAGTPAAGQADALRALGHAVSVTEMKSGLAFLKRVATPQGERWIGAADPRRDGTADSLP